MDINEILDIINDCFDLWERLRELSQNDPIANEMTIPLRLSLADTIKTLLGWTEDYLTKMEVSN